MRNDDNLEASPAPPLDDSRTGRRLSYDLLRLICILGVVAIHTFGLVAVNPAVQGTPAWLPAAILSNGFVWVVPVFVMLSGALTLTARAHRGGPGAFLRRRSLRIIPALVVWPLVYLGIMVLVFGERYSPVELVTAIVDGSIYPHLYFLYLIAGLSFVAPVLAPFLREGDARRALVLGVVVTTFTVVVFIVPGVLALRGVERDIPLGILTYWLPYVGYFVLGYALSVARVPRAVVIGAGIVGLLAWLLVLFQASADTPVLDAFLRPDYLGAGVAVLSAATFVVGVRLLDRVRIGGRAVGVIGMLADAAFGVYLVHLIVLLLPYFLLPGFRDHTSFAQSVLAYVVILAISFPLVILARRVPVLRQVF